MLRYADFEIITFDCYGTLIDWECGILRTLRAMLEAHGHDLTARDMLDRYARLESTAQVGAYSSYRTVLRSVVDGFANELGFAARELERRGLEESIRDWPPFEDTVDALRALKQKYALAILSNIDDDLFADTAKRLEVAFDHVVTAAQTRAYKPSLDFFRFALERLDVPHRKVLHVAQSRYHDIAPARKLGLSTVWVNRRSDRDGSGATLACDARPHEIVTSLGELVRRMGLPEPDTP